MADKPQLKRLREALADRYDVQRELGSGGMATVYLATDRKLGRPVALKVLKPELAHALGPERFLREIEISARLHHPHILPLHDSGESQGFLYYTMPFVEGETLRDRLDREKQLPIEDAVQIAKEVADALSYAHSHDVLHRDIKPENILLESGHATVADFGIARAISAAGGDRITETGLTIGTPSYMSPEQAAGETELDGRSDLYSLGCVFFEMLAGQPPFTGATVESVIQQHLAAEPPSITHIRPAVPAEAAAAVSRALAKTPADRFNAVAQFAGALDYEHPRRTSGTAARAAIRRPVVRAVIAAPVLVLVIVILVWTFSGRFGGRSTAAPEQRDWVVIADFQGSADPLQLDAARELVSTALDQSQILLTVPRVDLRRGLRLAGKPDTTTLVDEVARELALRGSVRTVLTGRIDRVGESYPILLRLVDSEGGHVVHAQRGIAASDDELITTLDDLASRLRAALGELGDALAATRPLTEVATPSLPAFLKYVEAVESGTQNDFRRALALYRDAVRLDPGFAAAWRGVAIHYLNLGQVDSAGSALAAALEDPTRLTDATRLEIEAAARLIRYDAAGAYLALDELAEVHGIVSPNLGIVLEWLGRTEDALRAYRRSGGPFGPRASARNQIVQVLIALGRTDEAEMAAADVSGDLRQGSYLLVELAKENWAAAERIGAALASDVTAMPYLRERGSLGYAAALIARGAAERALAHLARSAESFASAGNGASVRSLESAIMLLAVVAGSELRLPNRISQRQDPAESVHQALGAAIRGDTLAAREYLRNLANEPDSELVVLAGALPLVDSWIASTAGRWSAVPEELGNAASWTWPDRPFVSLGLDYGSLMRWHLATAYEHRGILDSAVAVLETIATSAGMAKLWEWSRHGIPYPFAHFRLARLYAELEEPDRAEEHYLTFLETFTEPDPEYVWMREEAQRALEELARGR